MFWDARPLTTRRPFGGAGHHAGLRAEVVHHNHRGPRRGVALVGEASARAQSPAGAGIGTGLG